MADAAPAPAPAAPSTSTPSNGAVPNAAQAKSPAVTVKPTPSGRNNAGQFLPKDGTVGIEAKPAPVEAPWRFKEKLSFHGEEEEVDFDRETVKRNLQRLRAYEKKERPEIIRRDENAKLLARLAKEDPDEFLRLSGQDPEVYARKKLAELARLGSMTEEERAIHERDQKIAEYEAEKKERLDQEAAAKKAATHDRLVSTLKEKVGGALKAVAPQLGDNYEAVGAIANALKLQLAAGASLADVSPEELARDAISQRHGQMRAWAGSMDSDTLAQELGEEAVMGLLQRSLAKFEAEQGFEAKPNAPQVSSPPPPRNERVRIDAREVDRRMAELRRSGK